jgi:hypothetical protein
MAKRLTGWFVNGLVVYLLVAMPVAGRTRLDGTSTNAALAPTVTSLPALEAATHNVGRISLAIQNNGMFGTFGQYLTDAFTGSPVASCEYPKGSGSTYLYGACLWIGAVVGNDTLVSTGADGWITGGYEFYPDAAPDGKLIRRSTSDPSSPAYDSAVSEQDYIAAYTDTFTAGASGVILTPDPLSHQPHKPLGLKVTQKSYAWSRAYAEDFVILDYSIQNIGTYNLRSVYVGLYVDGDVYGYGTSNGSQDDLTGYLRTLPTPWAFSGGCNFLDTLNIAWIADNDGDFNQSSHVTSVTGIRVLRAPVNLSNVSYNWWLSNANTGLDIGPQLKAHYRDMGAGNSGTPVGDLTKYAILSNGELDYDQAYVGSIGQDDSIWAYPSSTGQAPASVAGDSRYLLSFGPFDLDPGQIVPLTIAYVAGEGFHTDPNNANDNLVNNYRPDVYTQNLHFQDLGLNATWASWMYDFPGYDTDGDGYAGKYRVCVDSVTHQADTIWYSGDGVPDLNPPKRPAPLVRIEPGGGTFKVTWNGFRAETTKDVFSRQIEFEGYRVCLGRSNSPSSFAQVADYDRLDFDKWTYNPNKIGGAGFEIRGIPVPIGVLRSQYAPGGADDTTWNPLTFSLENPYTKPGFPDSVFAFTAQGNNQSLCGINTNICKVYPDTVKYPKPPDWLLMILSNDLPRTLPDSVRDMYLTPDNFLKYYEYETTITGLLGNTQYWIKVVPFDFSSPVTPQPTADCTSNGVQVDSATTLVPTSADGDNDAGLPKTYSIRQNYPNPFNPTTRIEFALPIRTSVKLVIYNVTGQEVRTLVNAQLSAGRHEVDWDGRDAAGRSVSSGVYFYRLETPSYVETKKMVLMK